MRETTSGLWTLAAVLAAALALVSCADEPVFGDDGLLKPAAGTEVGKACQSDTECSGDYRCLRLGGEQLCVATCRSDGDCAGPAALCNPVYGSDIGWCELDEGASARPEPPDGDLGAPAPPPPDPGADPDTAPAVEPDPSLGPAPDPQGQTGASPENDSGPTPGLGQGCECDDECPAVSGHEGICVHGICMTLGDGLCARSGSTDECPSGSRCWAGTGTPICYPDCGPQSCDGQCDSDGSCVRAGSMDCYRSCGTFCDWSGSPAGTDEGGGDDAIETAGPAGECGTVVETTQWELLNADRARFGLAPLQCHDGLTRVARAHSEDMATRGYFSHTNLQGEGPWDRMTRAGISNYRSAGENIAWGQRTPAEVETTWMNSPGHRSNILSDGYTHVGVGVHDSSDGIYWTQLFASF